MLEEESNVTSVYRRRFFVLKVYDTTDINNRANERAYHDIL